MIVALAIVLIVVWIFGAICGALAAAAIVDRRHE